MEWPEYVPEKKNAPLLMYGNLSSLYVIFQEISVIKTLQNCCVAKALMGHTFFVNCTTGIQYIGMKFQKKLIVQFTVVCLVTLPLSVSEAGGDLALIQTFLPFIC